MGMGVAVTAGPGMSGSPVVSGGVHPGTVGQGSLGPSPGSGVSISSSSLGSNVGVGVGTGAGVGGTMPPLGLDFVKVSVYVFFDFSFVSKTYIIYFLDAHIFRLSYTFFPILSLA
jgi:hypothetical protein